MITVLSMWKTLESVRETVLREDLGGVMDIAGILACMMAAGAILKVVRTYMTGTNMDPWDIFRPLVLMLLVCNFNTLILTPVNTLTSIVSREAAEVFDMRPDKYVRKWGENMVQIGEYVHQENRDTYEEELRAIAEDTSVIGAFFSKLCICYPLRDHIGYHSLSTSTQYSASQSILWRSSSMMHPTSA